MQLAEIECRMTVVCLSPICFIFLPCLFLHVPLPKETINEKQVRVLSEHQPPKANLWEEEAFCRCYQKLKCCIFCSKLFFSPSSIYICVSVQHLGRVIENTAGDGCCERQYSSKDYSGSLFMWWEKWTSGHYHKEYLYRTWHSLSVVRLEEGRFRSPLQDPRATKIIPPRQRQPGTTSPSNFSNHLRHLLWRS